MKKFIRNLIRKFIIGFDISIWVIFLILSLGVIGILIFWLFCKPEYNALAKTVYHEFMTSPLFALFSGYVTCSYLMFIKKALKEKKVE